MQKERRLGESKEERKRMIVDKKKEERKNVIERGEKVCIFYNELI